VVGETFRRAGSGVPKSSQFFTEIFHRFAEGACWRIYDDVFRALDRLEREGVRYGILSNCDARLRAVLQDLGLADRIAALVLSCDVGVEKPDQAIFDAAARAAGCEHDRLALIGDEPLADGQGPLAAGWRQCLVSRNAQSPPVSADEGFAWAEDLPTAVERVLARNR